MVLFLEMLLECFQASEAEILRSFGFDAAQPMAYVVEDDFAYSIILLEFATGFYCFSLTSTPCCHWFLHQIKIQ